MDFKILTTKGGTDYELLDSGEGQKLERYGKIVVARPDPQAVWHKYLPASVWEKAHAQFSHTNKEEGWTIKKGTPEKWQIELRDLQFWIRATTFKHTGLFPEHVGNWNWIFETISLAQPSVEKPIKVLNLFGYTGGATLTALKAGAEVVHLDGSKSALTWAKENAELSELGEKPVRWILDDAMSFVKREIKRGNTYHGIIMDPPAFGRGPKGEVWKIEDNLLELLDLCKQLLVPEPLFFLMNGYASGYSAIAYKNMLHDLTKAWKGMLEAGELTIAETSSHRLMPAGIFARWKHS